MAFPAPERQRRRPHPLTKRLTESAHARDEERPEVVPGHRHDMHGPGMPPLHPRSPRDPVTGVVHHGNHPFHNMIHNMRIPRVRTGIAEVDRQMAELQAQMEHLRDRMDLALGHAHQRFDAIVPPAVQKEAHRKGFHIVAGFVATPLFLYTGLVYGTLAGLITLAVILVLEHLMARHAFAVPFLTRQLTSTRRETERFSWASIMFIVAALAILWLTPLPVAFAALAMLGLGDGMSALVGRSIGHHKLWYNPKKSWEGSLAGFLAGTLGALALTFWYYAATDQPYPLLAIAPIAIAGSLAATIAESMPQWEDNFSVPIASSATMLILWLTTGLYPTHGALIEYLLHNGLPPMP